MKIILILSIVLIIIGVIGIFNEEKITSECYTGLCDFSYYDRESLIINTGCCDDWNGTSFIKSTSKGVGE